MKRAYPRMHEALPLLLAAVLGGCVGTIDDSASTRARASEAAPASIGRASFALQLQGGVTLSEVSYDISLDATTVISGTLTLSADDPTFRAVFVLAPGSDYVLTLEATPASGPTCHGSATFDIVAGETTPVSIALSCPSDTGSAGGADVSGFVNQCATVSSLIGSRATAPLGETITFQGVGEDPDEGPYALAYMWTATSGNLLTPAAMSTDLICTSSGASMVTVRVFDGDPGCPATTASIEVTCIDPPSVPDGGISDDDAGF